MYVAAGLTIVAFFLAWIVFWWGSDFFEIRGFDDRIDRYFDRRFGAKDSDGLAVTAARSTLVGLIAGPLSWLGFLSPVISGAVLYLIYG